MLEIQKYLRSGKPIQDLKDNYFLEIRECGTKLAFNYSQLESPMKEKICQESRGLILRKDSWDIVAFPFEKFFNYEESGAAKIDWGNAKLQEKLDGTLISYYFDDEKDKWFFATRSIAEADLPIRSSRSNPPNKRKARKNLNTFTDLANRCIEEMGVAPDFHKYLNKDCTYIFELTSPANKVVVLYKDYKLTMIGIRNNKTLLEGSVEEINQLAKEIGFPVPKQYSFDIGNIPSILEEINKWKAIEHEGLVVKMELLPGEISCRRVKIKTLPYKAAHYLVDPINTDKGLIRLIVMNQIDDVIDLIADHEKMEMFKSSYAKLVRLVQQDYERISSIEDMKEFALAAKKMTYPSALFSIKRGFVVDANAFFQKMVTIDFGAKRLVELIGG